MVNHIKPYIMYIMMRKILIKINCTIVFFALSQMIYAQDSNSIDSIPETLSYDQEVALTFNSITARKSTGSVFVVDVEKELKRDQGATIYSAINGKVPGMLGGTNTWGTGGAIVIVDGIRQTDYYINSLSLMEVESMVILKDAVSKAMYGVLSDNGVIVVSTKRGKAGEHTLRIAGSYGTSKARALPDYLNAADYMTKYNEAQQNDGVDIGSLRYTNQDIAATRSGEQQHRYPDNDFYSDQYIKDNVNDINVFADLMGGSDKVKYYVNTSYNRNDGWLNTPKKELTNRLNFRGNLDFAITDYLAMSVNSTARMSFNKRPNAPNIWSTAAGELPNNYPITWDPNLIEDEELREFIMDEANLIDGQLLGGNSSFLSNVYGNLTQRGASKDTRSEVQFGIKLDIDMSFITQGLSAKVYGGMNFYNKINTNQDPKYKVYEPIINDQTGIVEGVNEFGADKAAGKFHANANNSEFFRLTTFYGTLNYNRSFGEHAISATGMAYADIAALPDQLQKDAAFNTGVVANYMYANKYIVEATFMGYGSRKLEEGSRIETAPGVGLGWVLSEERFLKESSLFDYLKLRTSYGITKNNDWGEYFLYKQTFTRGSSFNYENGASYNGQTNFASLANNIGLQKRRDFTFGVDAILLDNKMNVELGIFKSESLDNITTMTYTYPQILGYEHLIRENYNSRSKQGIEFGLNYRFDLSKDMSLQAGANGLHMTPEYTKREEPVYEGVDAALTRVGTASDAMWGLKSDGLYGQADFNADGSLIAGLPVPSFGDVQPGDIKYLDQNSDDIIDNLDQRILGHGQRTQYSLYLDFKYKNFELFVLGIGYAGDSNYRSGSYYRVMGDVKYSTQANLAYGPDNMDVNATHPRLSTKNVSNNNRNSDYWMYKNNTFTLPTQQITYTFNGASDTSVLKGARIYVRATNVLTIGENKEYTELNVGSSPKTKSLTIGLVTSF